MRGNDQQRNWYITQKAYNALKIKKAALSIKNGALLKR